MKYELPRCVCLGMQLLPYISLLWALCVVVFLFNIFSKYAPVHASLNIGQVNAYMCQVSVFIDDKIVIIIVLIIINSIICHCPLYKFSNYLPPSSVYIVEQERQPQVLSDPYLTLSFFCWSDKFLRSNKNKQTIISHKLNQVLQVRTL